MVKFNLCFQLIVIYIQSELCPYSLFNVNQVHFDL